MKLTTKKIEVLIHERINELYDKNNYTEARLLELNLFHTQGYLPTLLEICKNFNINTDSL
jgi:hypothetical protein